MNIICPECGKIHILPKHKLPERRSAVKCKKCGARIIINPQLADNDPSSQEQDTPPPMQTDTKSPELDILLTENEFAHSEEVLCPISAEEAKTKSHTSDHGVTTASHPDIYATFPGLADLSPDKFIYREILAPTEKQGYQTRDNARIVKIARAVHNLLTTKILHEDEQVKRLARGIAYYPFEIPYANGLLTMLSNYFAIVCTNKRLLLINIDGRITRPTRYIFQLPYHEIDSISRSAFRSSLIIENNTSQRWNFTTVGRNLAKSLRDFIFKQSQQEVSDHQPDNLPGQFCPACATLLPEGLTSCSHCSVPFKKPAEAMIRSLVLPGLGSIYLSYRPLGIMEMAGYLAVWLIAMILLIMETPGGIFTGIAPVLAYHAMAGFLARKTAGKGYLLENKSAILPATASNNNDTPQ